MAKRYGGEPRLEETKRIGRVLEIAQRIRAQPRCWTRARLAGQFGISERMLDNDLQLIRHSLRYELRHAQSGYYFAGDPLATAIDLSVTEALALVLATQEAQDTGTIRQETGASILARLEGILPTTVLPYTRRAAMERAQAIVAPAHRRDAILSLLLRAQLERRRARITYRSASHGMQATERTVAPYRLVPYQYSWQLVAHDDRREEVRMFKIDRIDSCRLTEEYFTVPGSFDLDSYLGDTWGVLRGTGGDVRDVVLLFSPLAAPWVQDQTWHHSQRVEELASGGIRMCFHCTVTDELVRWVLSFGDRVQVEEPVSLREAVVEEARRVVEATISRQKPKESGPRTGNSSADLIA